MIFLCSVLTLHVCSQQISEIIGLMHLPNVQTIEYSMSNKDRTFGSRLKDLKKKIIQQAAVVFNQFKCL